MIIENLKLKRFGGHESIDFNSNSSVVGVFGPNGSGKSTLLEALKFAITGETANSQASYVKDLAGSGSVASRFRKNGKLGVIERNIGAKMTRSLDWDGRHITAAKEVASTMADIFGADKKAVANAVFVSQGQMQNLLFCGAAERRDAFVELLNLSFCAGRAEILYRKIQKLQSTIVDLVPARDAALSQRDAAAQVYMDKKHILEGSYSWETECDYLGSTQKARNELQIFQTQLNQAGTDYQIKASELQGLLTKFGLESALLCQEAYNASTALLSEMETQISQKQSVKTQLSHYDRVSADISGIYKELSVIQAKVFAVDPDKVGLLEWMKRKGGLDEDERQASRRKYLSDEALKEEKVLDKLVTSLPVEPAFNAEDLAQLQKQGDQLALDASTHSKSLATQKEIIACFGDSEIAGKVKCPKCALTITDANRLSVEEIARMEEMESELQGELSVLRADYSSKKAIWEKYAREVLMRARMRTDAQNRITAMNNELLELPAIDVVVVAAEREKLDGIISVLRSAANEDQSARKRLSAKLQERGHYTLAAQYMSARGEYSEEVVGALVVQKEAEKSRVQTMGQQLQMLQQAEREIGRLVKLQAGLQKEIEGREQLLNRPETEHLIALRGEIVDMELLSREVQARNKKYGELSAQVAQLEETYLTTNKSYHEIEDRMKRDEIKRGLIKDLLRLRELLDNDGLPLSYARLQFEKLAELTQINLAKLNPTFAIEVDRSKDLAFTFKRLDVDSGVVLPMSSLSGGQRVRLCVAFLIAVQKQLVPEVGLLVLDEPTTSVDTVGRVEIAEFLASTSKELYNTEMQVWVCDHSEEVKDRIECKLELK